MRKRDVLPKALVLNPHEMQPTLAEAFTRWVSMGEWPPGSILCKHTGALFGSLPFLNINTEEYTAADNREYLCTVQVFEGKRRKFFVIFGPEGAESN